MPGLQTLEVWKSDPLFAPGGKEGGPDGIAFGTAGNLYGYGDGFGNPYNGGYAPVLWSHLSGGDAAISAGSRLTRARG
jgi:hypothetical protein